MQAFIQQLARDAGQILLDSFGSATIEKTKAHPSDLVTNADMASNTFLIDRIRSTYPAHGILSEETGSEDHDREYVWIIDPLDGTNNFAHLIPQFGVLLALRHHDEVILACFYDPVHDDLFFAEKGKGAYWNGNKMTTSDCAEVPHSLGCVGPRIKDMLPTWARVLERAKSDLFRIYTVGCIGHSAAYVASGRRDWLVADDDGMKMWDIAPCALLLSESGCLVTDRQGNPWTYGSGGFVAANPTLHKQLLEMISE